MEDLLAINELTEYIVNQKQNVDKQKVNWVRDEKSAPLTYKYSTSDNNLEQWEVVDLKPVCQGRPADIGRASLQLVYRGPRAINQKVDALKDFNPLVYHSFYQNIN